MQWRRLICDTAADKTKAGQIRTVITEVVNKFREMNPEGLAARNGEKVLKPRKQLEQEAGERNMELLSTLARSRDILTAYAGGTRNVSN